MSQTSKHDLESNDVPSGLWGSRTLMEKISLPIIVILVIISIALLVVMFVTPSTASKNEQEVCSTPGCVQAANNLLNAMNTSVDPCTDFFKFSCGLWIEQHPIPDDKDVVSNLENMDEQLTKQLRVLMEQNVTTESKVINMVRITYQSCMNKAKIEELKSRPIFESLNTLGKWPILESNWDNTSFKLADVLITSFRDNGVGPFFGISVNTDIKNNSREIIFIEHKRLSISMPYFLDHVKYSKQINNYRKHFQKIVQLLKTDGKLNKSVDEINRDIDKVIAFETEIAKILASGEQSRDMNRMFSKRKIQDLSEMMPQIDWVDFFKRIAPSDLAYLFNKETELMIMQLDLFKKFSKLLNSTDADVIANYVIWRVVQSNIKYLDDRFNSAAQAADPRWMFCVSQLTSLLLFPTGAMYVQTHFQNNDKYEAVDMVLHLKSSLIGVIQQNDWMDQETKDEAIAKVNAMVHFVGYNDNIKDFKKLDDKYKGLEIKQGDSFFQIIKTIGSWSQMNSFYALIKPSNRNEADIPSAMTNAAYSPINNRISFPAGILQPPLFNGMFPKAVNYGAIGAVIGHEITHGFDDQGSKFDKEGKMRNWWSNSSRAIFEKKTKCIVEQYNGYTVPGTTQKLNGENSQGENIADIGGLKIAFRAYQKYLKEHGEEPRLPGIKQYTNEQIFFLSFAHNSCENPRDAYTKYQVQEDVHPPGMFRVNGVLSNMKEFADAYNCPKNSPINPDHKCVVW